MINARNTLGTGRAGRSTIVLGFALALAALALLARGAAAQGMAEPFDLYGTVVDANTGTALVGAWVSLPGTEWGSVSDDRGRFRIPDTDPGPLVLVVEQIGYERLEWSGEVSEAVGLVTLEMEPRPVLLEGLRIVTDRFESRRRATATSVRAYDAADLSTTSQRTALDFITLRAGSSAVTCQGRRGDTCLFVRGRVVEPLVYIDEMPVVGGLEYLDSFAPYELHMIEIFGGGRHIRAYTPRFMELAAEQRLLPIPLFY